MRLHFFFTALAILFALQAHAADTLKIATFNLRYASERPPNSWPERRPVMKETIASMNADIIGTQEGVYHQLKDIAKDSPHYEWIGLGREGGSRGEFMAIYYKPERFEPMEYDHFWLSDTPDVIGSSTWGNTVKRMVTWVRFKDVSNGKEFYFVNTHFDHQVQVAREKAADLLLARVKKLNAELPVIVVGDFNARAGANKAYTTLTSDGWLQDTWHTAKEKRGKIVATFGNFRAPVEGDNRIDWILGRKVDALSTEIVTFSKNGQYPSDHFPVVVELRLQ